jgi:DNA-binding HxlR family transcriptional regulator
MLSERFKELKAERIVIHHIFDVTLVRIENELTDKSKAFELIEDWIRKIGRKLSSLIQANEYMSHYRLKIKVIKVLTLVRKCFIFN